MVAFCALVVGGSSYSLAADLPISEPVIVAPSPVYDWNGFYVGGQLGYGWLTGKDNLGNPETDLDSVVGGLHAGYNYTISQFLIGVEAEANLAGFNETSSIGFKIKNDWWASARLRTGVTFDRVLAFGTVGISMTELQIEAPARGTSDSNLHTGLVLGAGLEALVTKELSVRLEYQHTWYENKTYNLGQADFKVDGEMDVLRIGASYHF